MTSLRLERAAAVRWRQLLITPLPPRCKGQCVQSNVMTQVRANRAAAVTKRRELRPPMVSLELPWKDASVDTLIRVPEATKTTFYKISDISGRRCPTRPPMVSLKPPWKYASIDTPHTLIRDPWSPNTILMPPLYFRAILIGQIKPLQWGTVVI